MSFTALFLASLLITNIGNQCATPTDEFAVEVVVPNYDVNKLEDDANRYIQLFYAPTRENGELITLFEETNSPKGLSVRIQTPTQAVSTVDPGYSFISTTVGVAKKPLINYYLGWAVSCSDASCVFTKGNLRLEGSLVTNEATFDIDQDLEPCSSLCDGRCFSTSQQSLCVNRSIEREVEPLLRLTNLSRTFDEFFDSARLLNSNGVTVLTIGPRVEVTQSWSMMMSTELTYWNEQGVLNLTEADIQAISGLARRGQAGSNYRIVYDSENKQWTYYNRLPDTTLTTIKECRVISLEESSSETTPQDLFYLVPIILGITALLLFAILIVIARALSRHSKKESSKDLKTENRS